MTENLDELKKKLEEEKTNRARACMKEIEFLLEKYNCKLLSQVTFRDGLHPIYEVILTPKE